MVLTTTDGGSPAATTPQDLDEVDEPSAEPEHPASDEDFAIAAAFAHLTAAAGDHADAPPPPPPLWPMLLHLLFTNDVLADPSLTLINNTPAAIDRVPAAVQLANGSVHSLQIKGLMYLRKLVSIEQNPPLQAVMDAGGIPIAARYLLPGHDEQPDAQFQALWLLTNIASGTAEQTAAVVDHPQVLHQIVRHLGSPSKDVAEQAVWAVGNIAGDGAALRDRLIECDAVPAVCAMVDDPTKPITTSRNATWALSNLVRGKPSPPLDRVRVSFPSLLRVLRQSDEEVAIDALWALSYLTNTEAGIALLADDEGGASLRFVMTFLQRASSAVVTPALRTVGNVCSSSNSKYTLRVVEAGFVAAVPSLLNHPKKAINKEAAWTLSNILAEDAKTISFVLNTSTLMRDISTVLENESKPTEVLKELQWCLANAASGGSQVELRGMIAAGALDALFHCLLSWSGNDKPDVALEGLTCLVPEATSQELAPYTTGDVTEELQSMTAGETRGVTAAKAEELLSLLESPRDEEKDKEEADGEGAAAEA